MTRTVDLVADLGEGFGAYRMGDDNALLDILTSANIACGFHAGDPRIMDATVKACVQRRVAVGAHPSFPDLVGFGRRAMDLTADEVRTDVLYQIGRAPGVRRRQRHEGRAPRPARPAGQPGRHPRRTTPRPSSTPLRRSTRALIVLAQDGELADAARARGMRVGIVGIADRAYRADGTLVPRTEPGAVLHDEQEIAERTVRMVVDGEIRSVDGTIVPVRCDTVLLHGDNPAAISLARRIRAELQSAGVRIAPLRDVLRDVARPTEPVGAGARS